MLAFDASSMIYAWDTYPNEQFPPLWRWMAKEIREANFGISQVAFEEVKHKYPECAEFLSHSEINCLEVSDEILQEAVRIKGLLGIVNDQYHPNGVDENDILIIATASVQELELVSDESPQPNQPQLNSRLRIPRVCQMPSVAVNCISFFDLITRSGEVFE